MNNAESRRSLADFLRLLHELERPILKANDWEQLRVPVRELFEKAQARFSPVESRQLLEQLRLEGEVLLLPPWPRWNDEEGPADGKLEQSLKQWQPSTARTKSASQKRQAVQEEERPSWVPRQVFLPKSPEHWFVRSRVAEVIRLLSANRERFGLETATAHVSYELQERRRPDRESTPLRDVSTRLHQLIDSGTLSGAEDPATLRRAVEIVAAALGNVLQTSSIAAFQERAWASILQTLFAPKSSHRATMITAGVSSGKTFSFLLPALTLVTYRVLTKQGGKPQGGKPRVLVIYPRTSLVEDQHRVLRNLLQGINVELERAGLADRVTEAVALDAGEMLAKSLGEKGSLAEVLPKVKARGIEIILTTAESLKNRMIDPRAVTTYLEHMELIILDEIHLMEGLAGTHGIYFIRRLRHAARSLRKETDFEPAWVGASATVAEPVEHAATVFSLDHDQVRHIAPRAEELIRFGTFHHALIHTRVGKPSISALTNGVACLVHNRNNSTAHSHYLEPSAEPLERRPTADIEKTLVFVDSLTTIGRLRFTTADNENCHSPYKRPPPYYAWFYQPASRHDATAEEKKEIGHSELEQLREWCRKCHRGEPAELPAERLKVPAADRLKPPIFSTLRISQNQTMEVPGLRRALDDLRGDVGNLDGCPFLKFRLCWWFSQDAGARRALSPGRDLTWIDQNRAIAYTSKTEEEITLHDDVNDYFRVLPSEIWPPPFPSNEEQVVSTLLASPRIEVGVDFKKVRDGVTHKALRSAASFQQKAGRVGREDHTDSIIVTFLAHRPTDAHFAHQPTRLIEANHLDPIPLKDQNLDVLKHHLFAAALEWIASRPASEIPSAGRELNIIGTGSDLTPAPWEDKVRACITYLRDHHAEAQAYLLAATEQSREAAPEADEAIRVLIQLLELFVADLSGAYREGRTPAHWFKQNQRVYAEREFEQLMELWPQVSLTLGRLLPQLTSPIHDAVEALSRELDKPTPASQEVHTRAAALHQTVAQVASGIAPSLAGSLFSLVGEAQTLSDLLGKYQDTEDLSRLKKAHEIVKAFFHQVSDKERQKTQYYLHDLLTQLVPFRDYYHYGLVRTHFQHVNEFQVQISLGRNQEDTEALGTVLYELLPGSWNYRWVDPRKSFSGLIDANERGIRLDTIPGAAFEPLPEVEIPSDEVPIEMPGGTPGGTVKVYRPLRLSIRPIGNQPQVRLDNHLVGDDDEAPSLRDPHLYEKCFTLPRASPATWYRVAPDPKAPPIEAKGSPDPAQPLLHGLPALGRAILEGVTRTSRFQLARYVYALERNYGISLPSPILHYRWGDKPVVLGDTFKLGTDALTLKLKPLVVKEVLDQALSQPRIRAELTARALRQFIVRTTRCDPFQANMLRKVVLASHLSNGGTLLDLDPSACATAFIMDRLRFDHLVEELLDGVFAGVDPSEIGDSRQRQEGWYDDVWPMVGQLAIRAGEFNDGFLRDTSWKILVHTFAVCGLEAVSRLVGAVERDLGYFFQADPCEAYVFDSVDGGNGYTETAARFFQIPPLRRAASTKFNPEEGLPSLDGFTLLQQAMATCPAQIATRVLFEACQKTVPKPENLSFPKGPPEDLQARIRHEFNDLSGAQPIIDDLLRKKPTLFSTWEDLLWLELCPEWFTKELVDANVCSNFESLRSRTHVCVTGCLECIDNGSQSLYGALASREHVSRNLLDLLKQHCVTTEQQSYLSFSKATEPSMEDEIRNREGTALLVASGAPLAVTITFASQTLTLPVPRQEETREPTLDSAELLKKAGLPKRWEVHIPLLVSFRDEKPLP
jgi:Lhr-like helicase